MKGNCCNCKRPISKEDRFRWGKEKMCNICVVERLDLAIQYVVKNNLCMTCGKEMTRLNQHEWQCKKCTPNLILSKG